MSRYGNIDEWAKAFNIKLGSKESEQAYLLATQQTIGQIGLRIFENGMAINGSIGKYDNSKEIYVSNDNSPRNGTLRGKGGSNKFADGKKHRTTFYNSYSDFRGAMGRSTSSVNLRLSGRLYRNFLNSIDIYKTGSKPVTIPNMITPAKLGQFYYAITLRKENMVKARGNEQHFNKKIFGLNTKEKIEFKKRVKFELIKSLKR